MVERNNEERRHFIKLLALGGVATAITGIPLATYFVTPALNRGTAKWVDLGSIEAMAPDQVKMLTYEFQVKDGWLVLPQRGFVWGKTSSPEKITVFSSSCTHLACNVIWRKEKQIFECPCHSGYFDMDGRPIAGPPSKPLVVLDHKLDEGSLKVLMPA